MEEGYTLTWEDATQVVQNEEVICGIQSDGILQESEFSEVCEEVVANEEEAGDESEIVETDSDNIMYLTEGNVIVMQPPNDDVLRQEFIDCEVTTVNQENWVDECPEIIVGSEEHIGTEEQPTDDLEIPLPTHQDQYTAARPYPCDFCSRRFRKKANLMNHMVAHQTDRPFGCNLCGVRYIRKCDLMNHLKIHAIIPDPDSLGGDEEEFAAMDELDAERALKRMKRKKFRIKDGTGESTRSFDYVNEDVKLMEAMENRSGFSRYLSQPIGETRFPISDPRKPFVCQHCGVSFAREKALASHSRVHGGDSPFECRTCGEVFWDAEKVREHVRIKHGGVEPEFDEDDDDDDEDYSDEDTRFGQFFCPTCGMAFHRQDNLRRHQRMNHVKEEVSTEEFSHVCNVCGETFPEALELLAHAEVHARTSEHRCMICGELYYDEQAIAAHVQEKHGQNLPPNSCMICGRTCKDRRTLLKHSFEHTKEKLFACTKCDKTFHNKARLKRHMISHRDKAVSCDVCGEDFPDGRSLMNHRHSHSSVSGRQFPCRECGKTFGSRSSQQIHIRIHTGERPYGCRFCWKAFADGGTLRKHERIHTGEKPYACAVCPRAFNQRVVLREHIRSHHSGPDPQHSHSTTPFCCAVCSDLFATSQDLIIHLIHHCDLNTAMKRQPQIGPRKYKRRRKLKPHELELMTTRTDLEDDEDNYSESEEEREFKRKIQKKTKKTPPKQIQDPYTDVYNSFTSAIENIGSLVKTPTKTKKKIKADPIAVPSRPKMIHTQKARVPVDGDGKIRHKTKTLVTHTQPTELRSATGERIRPRTKNVSYHIIEGEKFPIATFPDDAEEAVNNLLASEAAEREGNGQMTDIGQNGLDMMEVASEQVIEEETPVPISLIKTTTKKGSLKPGRHIIGPGSKVVRLVKGGMIVKNKMIKEEPECITPDLDLVTIKQEVIDPSPLHELAEISMQHAQQIFRCEMCSEIFSDREQLLEHVPIHI